VPPRGEGVEAQVTVLCQAGGALRRSTWPIPRVRSCTEWLNPRGGRETTCSSPGLSDSQLFGEWDDVATRVDGV
jgi:hypothetical protein